MFAQRTLHTYVIDAHSAELCRVCSGAIRCGDRVRARQWHHEYAHEACGWLRPDEREPHERRRPGTVFAYWEWQCPACELDACSPRAPRDGDPRECKRCRPTPPLGEGVKVDTIVTLFFRVGRGKRPRTVNVPAYTRGTIRKVAPETVLVALDVPKLPPQWLRRSHLSAV
jgi:hypothetical protein